MEENVEEHSCILIGKTSKLRKKKLPHISLIVVKHSHNPLNIEYRAVTRTVLVYLNIYYFF